MDMFQIANAATIIEGDFGALESRLYSVEPGLTITLPYEVREGSVAINGLEETSGTPAAGEFTVTITSGTSPSAEIQFFAGDVVEGDDIRVFYRRRINNSAHLPVNVNTTSARGELWCSYPVFSSGTDCADGALKGAVHIFIPRCRATTLPGFEASYKTAQTYSITFSAIDPKRADNKMYSIFFEPYDLDGNIVTDPSGSVNWNVSI